MASTTFETTPSQEHTQIVIKKLRRYASQYFSPAVLENLEYREQHMMDSMCDRIDVLIDLPAEELKTVEGTANFETPATWFDHLRQTYFPNFLTEKYPIKTETHSQKVIIEVGAVYPKFSHAFPKESEDMRFYSVQKANWSMYGTE